MKRKNTLFITFNSKNNAFMVKDVQNNQVILRDNITINKFFTKILYKLHKNNDQYISCKI